LTTLFAAGATRDPRAVLVDDAGKRAFVSDAVAA